MNKYIIPIILLAISFATFTCTDNTDEDQPDPKVYIVNGQKDKETSVTLYDIGEKSIYPLSLYRSGKHGSGGTAKVSVLTQTELEAYNSENKTKFVLLNTGYSLLNTEVKFGGKVSETLGMVDIEFDPAVLKPIIGASNNILVVPIHLESSNFEINDSKSYAFVSPTVKEPLIYMGLTGFSLFSYKSGEIPKSIDIEIPVKVDFKNSWDIKAVLGIDQTALDDYNTANESFYAMLPEGTYLLDKELTIANGSKQIATTLKVDGVNLPLGNYILPLEIASVSRFGIDNDRNSLLVAVSTQAPSLDRSNWKIIDFSTEEPNEGSTGLAKDILDGNLSTFWHSKWAGGSAPLPHHLVVDMGEEKTITQVGIARRNGNSDTKTVEVYISSNNSDWDRIGKCEMDTKNGIQAFGVLAKKGRYIKLVVTESRRSPFASIAEFEAYGF